MVSDLQRRVLGSLSIPRNVREVSQAITGYAYKQVPGEAPAFYTEEEVARLLAGYEARGWAVNLGDETNAAKLASAAQKSKEVMDFTDERAEIWSRRVTERADLNWRVEGDSWMLSKEGLALLHAPLDDEPAPMNPQQVQAAIDAEWARTIKGVTTENMHEHADELEPHRGGSVLLEDQFQAWLNDVLKDTKDRWGEMAKGLHGPMAGGASGWSDAFETAIIDAENQKTNLASPAYIGTSWFMGLSILALTDADTGTTIEDGTHKPTYTGYGKATVLAADMNAASSPGGSASNANAIIFAACTAGSSTILAAANCSQSASGGQMRKWFDVASTSISTTQTPAQFAASAYTTTAA